MKFNFERILVVDDSKEICQAIKIMLGKDREILYASNGNEAIDMLRQYEGTIDCILMDIVMPDMNGLEAFQEIRKFSNTAVLFMSGYCHKSYIRQVDVDGRCGFINKPFTARELHDELMRLSELAKKASY